MSETKNKKPKIATTKNTGSNFEPTEQQRLAIESRTGNVFVSAAAGSGKTRAMTERFVEAVTVDDVPVDRILTITFTIEAAAQLQNRIRTRLAESGRLEDSRRVPDTYISTIHSFCSRVLRAHPFAAEIDPGFVMLEDFQAKLLMRDAINTAIETFANRSDAHLEFIYLNGKDKLAGTVIDLYDKLRSAGHLKPADGIPQPNATPLDRDKLRELSDLIDELKRELHNLITGGDRNAGTKTYKDNFARAENLLDYLDNYLVVHPWNRPIEDIEHDSDNNPDNAPNILPGIWKAFGFNMQANLSKQVFGHAKELIDTIDQMLTDNAVFRYHSFYSEIIEDFDNAYTQKKAEVSGLDFEDLQLLVKRLFEQNPEIRESYRRKFKLIMVDEFQDTNRLQCDIIDNLSNDNIFTVGDEFQSIYLFRHADVSVFRNLRGQIGASAGIKIEFPENFRSREEIIGFINRIGASDRFFGDDHLHLIAARSEESFKYSSCVKSNTAGDAKNKAASNVADSATNSAAVELAIVDKQWDEIDCTEAEAEANYIALRIRRLLDEGIYSPDDIAILVPTRNNLREIETALKHYGIDYFNAKGKDYHSTDEVTEIRDILSTIVNPFDDLSLIGTLRGPCVRLSDDTLYLLRKSAGKIDGIDAPLWFAAAYHSSENETDRTKLKRFIEALNELRLFATSAGISSTIEKVLELTCYDLCALMRDNNGVSRLANIRKLMRLADAYENLHGPDLAGFVRYLSELKTFSVREGAATFADENIGAVRIMTIHSAKGLQFPVVFLALSSTGGTKIGGPVLYHTGNANNSVGHGSGEIAFKVTGISDSIETPEFVNLKDAIKADEGAEQKRLLHVAVTRAEERLFAVGICDIDKKDAERKDNNKYIELLMAALNIKHRDAVDLRNAGTYRWHDSGIDCAIVCNAAHVVGSAYDADSKTNSSASFGDIPEINLTPVDITGAAHAGELSYTAIETYLECPHKFYLRHVVGIKQAFTDNLSNTDNLNHSGKTPVIKATSLGTIVHKLFETIDVRSLTKFAEDKNSEDSYILEEMVEEITNLLLEYPELDGSKQERMQDRIIDILKNFASSEIAGRLAKADSIDKEIPFSFLLNDVIISGKFDVLCHEGDRDSIVDYKTGAKGMGLKELEQKYALQMDTYALAQLLTGIDNVEVAIVSLENDSQFVSRNYTKEEIPHYTDKIIEIVNDINRIDQNWAYAKNANTCKFCSLVRFCRPGRQQPQKTLR